MNRLYTAILIILLLVTYFIYQYQSKSINTPVTSAKDREQISTYKIIAFGDSLTAGLGVNLSETYPAKLESVLRSRSLPVSVINMGISGDTTYGALSRVDFVSENRPQLVILGLGGNDMLQSLPIDDTYKNLDSIISNLKSNDIDVLLLGMKSTSNNDSAYIKRFDNMYGELAKKYNLELMPFMLDGVALKRSLNQADGIHPTPAGYDVIVKNMLPYVLRYEMR